MTKRLLLSALLAFSATLAAAQGVPTPVATEGTVMYATAWCPYCAKARAYFARKGIPYTERDVEKSAGALAEFRKLGGRGVPLIVHNGEILRGFSEASFDALLARAPAGSPATRAPAR
jgi:glutaredoxin